MGVPTRAGRACRRAGRPAGRDCEVVLTHVSGSSRCPCRGSGLKVGSPLFMASLSASFSMAAAAIVRAGPIPP